MTQGEFSAFVVRKMSHSLFTVTANNHFLSRSTARRFLVSQGGAHDPVLQKALVATDSVLFSDGAGGIMALLVFSADSPVPAHLGLSTVAAVGANPSFLSLDVEKKRSRTLVLVCLQGPKMHRHPEHQIHAFSAQYPLVWLHRLFC
jgi:hypothetical protein